MSALWPGAQGKGTQSHAPHHVLAAPVLCTPCTCCTPEAKQHCTPCSTPLESSRGATEPPLRLPFPDTCTWEQATAEDGGGKLAGGGSLRSPRSGWVRCSHPSQRCSRHRANAWLWRGAPQAVAPVRAVSCEAAPLLGITISPATLSAGKISPSGTGVISTEGVGLSVWEQHYAPDRDTRRVQH